MKKLLSQELFVSLSTISVFNTGLEFPHNRWTDHLIQQGFAWREGSVSFSTIGSLSVNLEVFLNEQSEVLPTVQRAIRVPFTVGDSGRIGISDDYIGDNVIDIPPGEYALLFENGFRSDVGYSEQEEELGLRPMWSRLTFKPSTVIQAQILREEPGAEIPLSPTYPLLMQAEPFHPNEL